MKAKTFRRWVDFGPDGIDPEMLEIEYDPDAEHSFPPRVERVVDEIWKEAIAESDVLHDGNSLNTLSVSTAENKIRLGPASFRHYYTRLLYLRGELSLNEYKIPPGDMEMLVNDVRILSSFTVVSTGSELVLGLRRGESNHLTFPGSGYLDSQLDVTEEGELKCPRDLVLRELDEELNLNDYVANVAVFGVFEDTHRASHHNPSIISLVRVDAAPDDIKGAWENATDAWEFQELYFLPLELESMNRFLRQAVYSQQNPIDLPKISPPEEATVHGKSLLAPLLVGRAEFGMDWYSEQLATLSNSITIDEVSSVPDI